MGLKRLLVVVVLGLAAAAALAGSASSLSIDDSTCPDVAGEHTNTCPTGTVGVPYSITFKEEPDSGCGPGHQTFHISSGSPPPGLSLSTSGTLSGTPTTAGIWVFYIEMTEGPPGPNCRGDSTQKVFTLPVVSGVPKLTLGPESTSPATVGAAYSLQMTASVPDAKTWIVSSGSLPPGLTLNASTGLISGTPTTAGTYSFQVYAKVNADSRSDTKWETVVVREAVTLAASAPFTPTRSAQGEVTVPFSATLTAAGGTGSFTWSLTGALPPGVTLVNGTIQGKPTTAGAYSFTVTVTDSEARAAHYPGRILVADKLAVSTLLLRPGKVGRLYQAKLRTSGGVKPASWRIWSGALPRGVRLDRSTGQLYGVPKSAGRYRVVFEATDALGVKAKKTLAILVAPSVKP